MKFYYYYYYYLYPGKSKYFFFSSHMSLTGIVWDSMVRAAMVLSLPLAALGSIFFSVSLVIVNKMVLQHHPVPFSLTLVHQLFGAAFSRALDETVPTVPVRDVLVAAATFCGGIVLMNLSLSTNSVGFYQIFKLLCTPAVAVLQVLLLKRRLSSRATAALCVLLIGVSIATVQDVVANVVGFGVGCAAVAVTAYSQVVLKATQDKYSLSPLQVIALISLPSAGMLGLAALIIEGQHLWAYAFGDADVGLTDVATIALSGLLAICANYFGFLIVGGASPLTFQVVGHLKTILTVGFGFLLFAPPPSSTADSDGALYYARTVAGLAIAILGMFLYWFYNAAESASLRLPLTSSAHSKD